MALLTLTRGDDRLVDLPTSWSNAGRPEQLQRAAAESFSNLVALAVAKSGTNFQLYDALRPLEEQIAMLQQNYRRVSRDRSRSSDRTWDGSTWEKRPGRPNTASPGHSNHGSGLAVDIHPGPIQEVFKTDGPAWGWSWAEGKRNGEDWHFVYVGGNRYASRGWLDHAAVQRAVGAEVDGKIGVGTVEKIKAWQKAHGLEVDGIVGPGTKAAMLGKAVADQADEIVDQVEEIATPGLAPAVDGIFPWADATTQFWDSKYPTQTYAGGEPIGLLHSTETGTWPGYGGGSSAPHLTVLFDTKTKTIETRQHFSTTRPARALVNKAGGVQTNNARVFQIELIGSCDRAFATKHGYPYLPDLLTEPWARDALAAVLEAVSATQSIPLFSSVTWAAYPGSYGEKAAQRLSGTEWEQYTGWLGHQHAPENDHGDPGNIPVAAILAAAASGAGTVVTAPTAPAPTPASAALPSGKDALMQLKNMPDFPLLRTPGHQCYYGDASGPIESVSGKSENSLNPGEIYTEGGKTRSSGLVTLQTQLVERGYAVDVDGRWGDQLDNAIDNLQRLAGLTRDKKCGPMTWFAAFLLPVQ